VKKIILLLLLVSFTSLIFSDESDQLSYEDWFKERVWVPDNGPQIPIAECVEEYFINGTWEFSTNDFGQNYMDFTGTLTYEEKVLEGSRLSFFVNKEPKQVIPLYLMLGGGKYKMITLGMLDDFIDTMMLAYIAKVSSDGVSIDDPVPIENDIIEEDKTSEIHTFDIGEAASDENHSVTVNSFRFLPEITEVVNMYIDASAPEGEVYVVVNITLENMSSQPYEIQPPLYSTKIIDKDGYQYSSDFDGQIALKRSFSPGGESLLPGMKSRGDLSYLVPIDAKGLQFKFKFGRSFGDGKSVVFNLN